MNVKRGDRVQLHPATDAWMQGDRYGEVLATGKRGPNHQLPYVRVLLDSGRVRRFHPENIVEVIAP